MRLFADAIGINKIFATKTIDNKTAYDLTSVKTDVSNQKGVDINTVFFITADATDDGCYFTEDGSTLLDNVIFKDAKYIIARKKVYSQDTNPVSLETGHIYNASLDSLSEGVDENKGDLNTVTSKRSHAEGSGNTINADASHAEGVDNIINSGVSGEAVIHVEGSGNTATGYATHAEGADNTVSGSYGHAEGAKNTVSGESAHASGSFNKASGDNQCVVGCYNTEIDNSADYPALFIVGNGYVDEDDETEVRQNAFVVYNDGSVDVQDRVNATNGFFQTSDERLKNITGEISLEKAYDMIDRCSTIIYTLKDQASDEQIGLIAQEVYQYFPELVDVDSDGMMSLDYARITVILMRVMKDLISRVTRLEK